MSKRKNRGIGQSSGQAVKTAWDKAEQRLAETVIQLTNSYVDPDEAFTDEAGERWMSIGAGGVASERRGYPQNDQELATVRAQCRDLACENPFAINGHENRVSYLVGSGHTYAVQAKQDEEVSDEDLKAVQAVIDDFCERNQWHKRQQEIVLRKDRDGECFLRFFPDVEGGIRVRFVEPSQIACPAMKAGSPTDTFGIQTDPEDVETVLGYWVDGQLVEADQIQHRKANVDCNVKRGMPMYWPVRRNLRRAEKLLRNMSVVGEIQTAIALIRKHASGTKAGVEQFVQNNANVQVTDAEGNSSYYRRYGPGTILDSAVGMEYDFPARGLNAGNYVSVLQAELRAIASRLVMPEFMLTSDASNANYNSTMVAEGPAVKMFERWQWDIVTEDRDVMKRVIEAAIAAGKLKADIQERIEVNVTPPNVQTRDRMKEVTADKVLVDAGAMSVRTMAERNDLDWDTEEERIDKQREKTTPAQLMPFAGGNGRDGSGGKTATGADDPNADDPNADDDTKTAFETWRGLVESIKFWRKKP